MSYIKALIKNLDQSSVNYETSDTDNEVDINDENQSQEQVNKNQSKEQVNKNQSKEQVNKNTSNNEKFEALLDAQNFLINKCKPSNKFDKIIKKSLKDSKWKGLRLTVKIDDDEINIRKNENNYQFSKTKFFSNKIFKYNLIKSFTKDYGDKIWIKIYKKDDDYKIFVCHNNKN